VLKDYQHDMLRCCRCSYCKWIPFDHVKSWRFAKGCPSVEFNKFQPYSAGGRLAAALSLIEGRSGYTDRFVDIVYNCLLCGSCDVACKVCRYNMEPLEAMHELRFRLVQEGQFLPAHRAMIENLRKENNTMSKPKTDRSRWADGLDIKDLTKETADVVFHVGCRVSYDNEFWNVARIGISLLRKAGVDVGTMGREETCCGGRAFHMGHRGDFSRCAQHNIEAWTRAGVRTVVTPCSDCYHSFKRLYPEAGFKMGVFHLVEFVDRLVQESRIKFGKPIKMKVTYHDPCHLGRQGEPYVPWKGEEKKIYGQMVVYDPPRPRYNGARGIYEPPRNILMAIPGLDLVEMERIREYAWCCGAGGGVFDAYPKFSAWTADERIAEAASTGAEAIVSACPWCERSFLDATRRVKQGLKVYDVIELVQQALD
jgi:Fe-S oxidoreductase